MNSLILLIFCIKNISYEKAPDPPTLEKQSTPPNSPNKFPSSVGELISTMAANFKAVGKIKSMDIVSPVSTKDSKSNSPPLLSPSISPKAVASFYG